MSGGSKESMRMYSRERRSFSPSDDTCMDVGCVLLNGIRPAFMIVDLTPKAVIEGLGLSDVLGLPPSPIGTDASEFVDTGKVVPFGPTRFADSEIVAAPGDCLGVAHEFLEGWWGCRAHLAGTMPRRRTRW